MRIIYKDILKKFCRLNTYMTINKGAGMNNYKIDDEVTKRVLSSYNKVKESDNINELINKINQANETFGVVDLPEYDEPNFERLDPVEINEDNIKKTGRRLSVRI